MTGVNAYSMHCTKQNKMSKCKVDMAERRRKKNEKGYKLTFII